MVNLYPVFRDFDSLTGSLWGMGWMTTSATGICPFSGTEARGIGQTIDGPYMRPVNELFIA